jgi:hypothetical protein
MQEEKDKPAMEDIILKLQEGLRAWCKDGGKLGRLLF